MTIVFYIFVFLLACASPVLLAAAILKMFPTLKRRLFAFNKTINRKTRANITVIAAVVILIGGLTIMTAVSDIYKEYKTNHAAPAEHLQLARDLCPPAPNGAVACVESEMDIALHHLDLIPPAHLSTAKPPRCAH